MSLYISISLISIHSPTRGLTLLRRQEKHLAIHFNSQPHKGADQLTLNAFRVNSLISIHSPTRGLTLRYLHMFCVTVHFNSQPHKGADSLTELNGQLVNISIHSPTRGLTPIQWDITTQYSPFQFTAPQGG